MKKILPSKQSEIKHFLSDLKDLKDFSELLMKVLIKLEDLTRYNKQLEFETYC